ncbi:MAG: DUF3352 domain-containing protein [Synechococcus sp. ELA057]
MKGRAFVALVLSVLLLLLGLGAGGWWLLRQRGPLQLAHQPLNLPRTARFVPASASFSLYVFSDGERPVDYARAVAPARQRRRAGDAVARLRDGAFAAAGLDYRQELAGWLGREQAVALFEDPVAAVRGESPQQPARGWLLALASRDDDGARRFLQRFWQTRSLAGTDLQVTSYRGMGLISGRGALLGSQPTPLATALVDDDLVLIASGRNLLERALDASQIDALNQGGLPELRDGLAAFPRGAALLLASPQALKGWLGLPQAVPAQESAAALLAVLQPQGRALSLGARLTLRDGTQLPALPQERAEALLAALRGSPTSLALVQDPADLAAHPLLGPWTRAWLGRSLGLDQASAQRSSALPELVAAGIQGPLLVSGGAEGWTLASDSDDPAAAALAPQLSQAGLIQAPLEVEGQSLQAWTRLAASQRSGRREGESDQLEASLAGWRLQQDGQDWWGQNLSQLSAAVGSRELIRLRQGLQALAMPTASWQWGLDAAEAREALRGWQPWRMLSALAGGGLDGGVQGLSVAVETPADAAQLQLRARLEFGA